MIGTPLDPIDPVWDEPGWDDSSNGGNDGNEDGGTGSPGGDAGEEQQKENCYSGAEGHYSSCRGIADYNFQTSTDYCGSMSRDPYVTGDDIHDCVSDARYSYDYDLGECSDEYGDDIAYCERNFGG
ncbi:hypothetical protein KIU71_02745 [Alteromonas sp. SM 2104]|nr:hypothetical protein [Alteromonas oceanisediminis]